MTCTRTKRKLTSLLVAALALSLLAAPAVEAAPGHGRPDPVQREVAQALRGGGATATASGWRKKCNRKRTKRKRRACRRRHRRAFSRDITFAGTMNSTVDYYDVCGSYLGRGQSQISVGVIAGPPLRQTKQGPDVPPAVGAESNPVRLVVGEPTVEENLKPGSISLASSQRFNGTSPNVNLQYWQLALNGAALSGTLVEDHREESGAYNLLSAYQQLVPCRDSFGYYSNQFAIAEGATLTGTLTKSAVSLTITGNVVEGTRPFAASLSATRVG